MFSQDFIERTAAGLELLNTLVSIGAFRFTGKTKKQLLWEANFVQKKNQTALHNVSVLFAEPPLEFQLPELADFPIDDLYNKMEILGFPLSNPFAMVHDDTAKYVFSKNPRNHTGKIITVLVYLLARKHVQTKNNDEMFFGTVVDCYLDWIATVHFPESARNLPLHTNGFYRITGKVVEDFGVHSVEVHTMYRVGYKK